MTLLFATTRSTAIISPPLVSSLLAYHTLRPTSALTVDTSRYIAWLRAIGVELQGYDEILNYLLQFPGMVNVLHVAVQAVRKHLADLPMTLAVYRDPEIDDRYLLLSVQAPAYTTAVAQGLAAAEAEFLPLLANEEGWLQLNAEIVELADVV